MHRSPSRPRTALVALALLVATLGAACGVDTTDAAGPLASDGGGGGGQATETATTLPPCDPGSGGGTGGLIDIDDLDPTCEPVDQPDPTDPDEEGDDGDDEQDDADTTTTTPDDEEAQGSPDQVYLDALIESLRESDSEDLQLTGEQAECLAPQWLEIITADALREAGITPEDLASDDTTVDLEPVIDQDQGQAMAEVFGDCGIDLDQLFIDGLVDTGAVADDQATCLLDALPEGYVEQLFAITLADGDDALDADPALAATLTDAFEGCGG